jgi:CRISPR-associated protein Cmr1
VPRVKDIPESPGVPPSRLLRRVTQEYAIQIVTPMFGGGVEAGETDPTFRIRGTSIRGQLQFWWRATRGASCSTSHDLLLRHAEVWGRTEQASPVWVEVHDAQIAEPKPCAQYDARQGQGGWRLNWESSFRDTPLTYALFPFQGKPPERNGVSKKPPSHYTEQGSFKLRIRFPEALRPDVETSVWAWVNFGGLGARTRRGCGTLFCPDLAPKNLEKLEAWFRLGVGSTEGTVRDWPTLPAAILLNPQQGRPFDAWKTVMELWRKFRQGPSFARSPGQGNRPGRSRYPEPETIRKVTGHRSSQHGRLVHIPDHAFPRAELGLPIVFHYQGHGEPPDTVLYPAKGPNNEKRERMASPMILKPLAIANGLAVPLAMRLLTPTLTGVDLRQGATSLMLPPTTVIRDRSLAAYKDSPLAGSASGSALDAFWALARKEGFREVTR